MADRKDWSFKQLVQENEMDESGDGLEQADRNAAIDMGLAAVDVDSDNGGIMLGLDAIAQGGAGNLNVDVSAGSAYDHLGQRVRVDSSKTVNITQTGTTGVGLGGTPTGGVLSQKKPSQVTPN